MQHMIAARMMTTLNTLRSRQAERGASALEYVGLVLIAALIVGAVWTAINAAGIDSKISDAVTKILTGGGGAAGGGGGGGQ